AVDRALDLLRPGAEVGELGAACLHHLGDAIEHLPPVVRSHSGPLREGTAGRPDSIAHVLPRCAGDVLPLRLVRPSRLGARELASDEELVRLADGEPAHSKSRYGSSPCRPPSRPKPDSL